MNTDHEVIEALGILIIGTDSEPLPGHQIHSGLGKSPEAHRSLNFPQMMLWFQATTA